ncbi:GUN4 domain-containing protein [Nodularia spumigena]|uniref:GUN4-like domain-containing protein n=1 Tax=Nodularia spumigena UHCC 0039 TaxID=1914872 RepID=A0A2S0Q9T2_NODSP|nr:GUN4 domain-containing protein [Nodularia spumigena]AVZ31209.1 hypothetical protein BMF81_03677 [Nodularia spumigena UHCC 0039]
MISDRYFLTQLHKIALLPGRFGFSAQKKKYLEVGGTRTYRNGTWEKYCKLVGWYTKGYFGNYIGEGDLIYDISAPEGHLPWVWLYRNLWYCNEQTRVTYPALILREDLIIR